MPSRPLRGSDTHFPDASFDAMYSSNLLGHAKSLGRIQAQPARVRTTERVAVHTSGELACLGNTRTPFSAARWVWCSCKSATSPPGPSQTTDLNHPLIDKSIHRLLRLGRIAPSHGEHGNLLTEYYLFSHDAWKPRFEQTGWQIHMLRPGLF